MLFQTHGELYGVMVKKNNKADALKYVGESPPLPDLLPSQYDYLLLNGMKTYPIIMVPHPPVVKFTISPGISSPGLFVSCSSCS